MQLILIGDKTSTLTSLVPETKDIELITLSKSTNGLVHYKPENSSNSEGLIIIDSMTCESPLSWTFNELKNRFPNYQIWVYYLFESSVIYKKLQDIGFQKVLSSSDNIPTLIRQHFEHAYCNQKEN